MKDIIIYEKKKDAIKVVLQALFMTVAAAVLVYMGKQDHNTLFIIVGGIGSIFFAFCLLVQVIRTIRRRPLFIIKENGVEDTSTVTSYGFIEYEEIQELVLGKTLGKESIGIVFKDVESFISKQTPVKQKTIKNNLANHFPAVVLRVDSVDNYTAQEVFNLLQKRLEEFMTR